MERKKLIAPEGYLYTDGSDPVKEIYLAVGSDGSGYDLISETDAQDFEEATEEDYLSALARLGVE